MCKDDGWFIRHVEPPNACRPSDNSTDRLAIGVCASKYVRTDPLWERVALSASGLLKSSMSASASRTSSTMNHRQHHGRVPRPTACPGYRPGAHYPYAHSIVPGGFEVMS